MTTERIDIIVSERGSRVVRRNIEDIGGSARTAGGGVQFLRKALAGLVGAFIVRELGRLVDQFTSINNILRVTAGSQDVVNQRFNSLLGIANRTRAPLDAIVSLYQRGSLAANELGASQADLLRFTENVGLALAQQGGSAAAASGALLQLSQSLGAGIVRAEEFNSILEGAFPIALAAANGLDAAGGSVARLRQLVIEGKVSSDDFFQAILSQTDELEAAFANTTPTISQAFTVLRNNLVATIGELDRTLGISGAVASAIILLANSLETLTAVALTAGAAFAAFKLVAFAQTALAAVQASRALAAAVAAGNATLLTAVDIERAKATSALASATAQQASTAAKAADIAATRVQLTQNLAIIQQERAQALAMVELQTGIAAATGRTSQLTAARAALNNSTRALLVTQRALRVSSADLVAAQAAEVSSSAALAAARTRQAAADAAASTWVARLTRQFPLLGGAIGLVTRAFGFLSAVMLANPIGAVIAAVAALVSLLVIFKDRIKVTADGVVSLGDVFRAVFSLIGDIIAPVVDFFRTAWDAGVGFVGDRVNDLVGVFSTILGAILGFIKFVVNTQIGIWVGAFRTVVGVWNLLPAAFEALGAAAINGLISVVDTGITAIVRGVGNLLEFIGSAAEAVGLSNPFAGLFDGFETGLDRFRIEGAPAVGEVFGQIGSTAADAFSEALNTDYVGTFVGTILARAREIAEARAAMRAAGVEDDGTGTPPGLPAGAGGRGAAEVADQVERMRGLLEDIRGPLVDYMADMQALDTLLASGAITAQEYADKWREIRIAFLETQTTFAAGLERGFLKVQQDLNDMASDIERVLTGAFKSAEDALTEFIQTGKLDFKGFVNSILEDLIRLSVRQTILNPLANALGGLLGFDASGAFGGDGGGAGAAALTGSATALTVSATALTGAASALSAAAAAGGLGGGLGLGGGVGNQLNQATQAAQGAAQAASTAAGSVQQLPGIFGAFQGDLSSLFGGLQGGLGGLFSGLISSLGGLFGNLMSGLGNIFSSIFGGGGGGGGFLTSMIGGIFGGVGLGFATGGAFTVGGGGGVDTQLVQFRASPGERVEVKRPGEQENGGGQRQQIVFNIQTPDVEGFRRSESQIAARLARMAQKGRRNL